MVRPRGGRARRSAWAAAALLAAAGPAAQAGGSDPPPCRAEAAFETDRATLGQQVLYRVRILSRAEVTQVDWSEPPSFPGFRVEWLPGRPGREVVVRDGVRYSAREESRALFPERPGELRAAPADLRCRFTSDAGERTFLAPVPAVALHVAAPPTDGRPPDFSGLIGPIALQTIVTPRELSLGATVRVAVMLRGPGNLWQAPEPIVRIAGAEIFRRRPELTFETGPRLALKRHFAYDVVPLRPGALAIPAVRVAYFDPATGRYAVAVSEPVQVSVGARAEVGAAAEPAARNGGGAGKPRVGVADEASPPWPWWPAAAALLAGGVALLALRRRAPARRSASEPRGGLPYRRRL